MRELYGSTTLNLKGTMMRTNDREWSRYETSAYRDARRAGMSVSDAFARAFAERIAHRILPPRDVWDYGSTTGWRVDASELAAATTDPRTDAFFGILCDGTTGERILSRVILPDGARATITVRDDVDGDPRTDGDCYSADDVAAWQADQWRYVSVEAHVTLADGRSDTAIMGGVETGEHWGMSLEASILHTVAGLISEALAGAEAIPVAGPPTVASMPGDVVMVDGVRRVVTSAVWSTHRGTFSVIVAHVAPDDVDNPTAAATAPTVTVPSVLPPVAAWPL